MKKQISIILLIVMLIFIVFGVIGLYEKKDEILSDYRPMIFVSNSLWGETCNVYNKLPNNAQKIGSILNVISQNEPMPNENFTSNVCPEGSEIYYDENSPQWIFVKMNSTKKAEYIVYEVIK